MHNTQDTTVNTHYDLLTPIFLMCQPDYYDPRIEKHRKDGQKSPNRFISGSDFDRSLALKQWDSLKEKLESLGAQVIVTEPLEGLVDQVFTTDSSISLMTLPPENGTTFKTAPLFHTLYSRFKHAARAPELQAHMNVLKSFRGGLEETHLNGSRPGFMLGHSIQSFEGGDNLYDPYRDMFWAGHGDSEDIDACRSSEKSHLLLREFMDIKVQGIEVANGFYHLDTSLAPLPSGHMLCYPGGMSYTSFKAVESIAGKENLIIVSEEDAQKFSCNIIVVDNHNIVMPLCNNDLRREMENRSFSVHMIDVSEFIKSGGGPHCLTNRVNQIRVPGGLKKFPDFYDTLRQEQ